jgi:hypothetical protein
MYTYKRNSMIKKERIIDLTDSNRNNSTPVIRELRSMSDPIQGRANDSINFVNAENNEKDLEHETLNLIDPDGQYEEQLEASGATILNSTTYYPDSRTTITKRSLTPEESAAERQQQYYLER